MNTLPVNDQRPTLNAQRSTSEFSNSSSRMHRLRSGMTMIELVAALALFIIIFGVLLTIMNTATNLWSSSRSQSREQSSGQRILALIDNDLRQIATDSGSVSNDTGISFPTLIIKTPPPVRSEDDLFIVLQFARHAAANTLDNDENGTPRLSLDAVYYTFYNNTLFRHVIPLSASFDGTTPLGELLDDQRSKIESKAAHDQLIAAIRNPTPSNSPDWTCTLLAERIELDLLASLPEPYARSSSQQRIPASETEGGLRLPPEYDQLETDTVPDRLDVSLCLYSAEDWAALDRLMDDTSKASELKKRYLGQLFSKRITFPTRGGLRLP